MRLDEAITVATYSELNTLSLSDKKEAIIALINLGLTELYNLFVLRTEEVVISLLPGKTIYQLPEDFMYIINAYTKRDNEVMELKVNEEKDPDSINTVGYNKLQIPFSFTADKVAIIYAQRPPHLTLDNLEDEIPLPSQMLQALFTFVAYKAHGAIRLDGQSEGDVYYSRFKQICNDLRQRGTVVASDDISMDDRLYSRGFP
jgi:hypothetical protein